MRYDQANNYARKATEYNESREEAKTLLSEISTKHIWWFRSTFFFLNQTSAKQTVCRFLFWKESEIPYKVKGVFLFL